MLCESPVLYHATHWSVAVHSDLVREKASWSSSRSALAHKHRSIVLIQEAIQNLDNLSRAEAEAMIVAVNMMAVCEVQPDALVRGSTVSPLTPHWPNVLDQNLYRMQGVRAHISAGSMLAERLGGLHALRSDFAYNLAFCDLTMSAAAFERPVHPCFWHVETDSIKDLAQRWNLPEDTTSGAGFSKLPGGLPPQAEVAFRNLSVIDQLMQEMRCTSKADPDFCTTRRLRDAVCYSVIALPPWEELAQADKTGRYLALYQLCRLTVGLYMTAVILARPPHSGWQTTYVERIRSLVELSGFSIWSIDVGPVFLWSLFVGGIAAYRTRHRLFFEQALRSQLLLSGLQSWLDVKEILSEFLWADSACEYGAAVLWDAVGARSDA